MTEDDFRGFNCSDRPAESTDDHTTCPHCETPISGFVTQGPSKHFLDPCGCRVTTTTARDLAGNANSGREVATDGGTSWPRGTERVELDDIEITDDGNLVDVTRVQYQRSTDRMGFCPFCQTKDGVEFVDEVGPGGTYRKQRYECDCGAYGEGVWTWEAGVKEGDSSDDGTGEAVTDGGPAQLADDRKFRDPQGRVLSVIINDQRLRYSDEQSTVERVVFELDHFGMTDPEPEDRPRVVLLNSDLPRWTAHYYPEGVSTVTNAVGLSKNDERTTEGELHLYAEDSPDVVIEYLATAAGEVSEA